MNDLEYMNRVYGGRHIRTNDAGEYIAVTDFLNYYGPVFSRSMKEKKKNENR